MRTAILERIRFASVVVGMEAFRTRCGFAGTIQTAACRPTLNHRRAIITVLTTVFERIVFADIAKDVFPCTAKRTIRISNTLALLDIERFVDGLTA